MISNGRVMVYEGSVRDAVGGSMREILWKRSVEMMMLRGV